MAKVITIFIQQCTFLILLFGLLSSCMQQSGSKRQKTITGEESIETDPNTTDDTIDQFQGRLLYWDTKLANTSSDIFPTSITINSSFSSVIYLKGEKVHNYLSTNPSQSLCLSATYLTDNSITKQFIAKAITSFHYNQSSNTYERILRIDLNSNVESQTICGGVPLLNSATATYQINEICPSCFGVFHSVDVSFYKVGSTFEKLNSTELDTSSLKISIDNRTNQTTPGTNINNCTDSICRAQGKDCCLNNQCVRNGAPKTLNFNYNVSEYNQAIFDVGNNPLNYKNYPQFFYVCPGNFDYPTNTNTSTSTDTGTDTDQIIQKQKKINDFYCLMDNLCNENNREGAHCLDHYTCLIDGHCPKKKSELNLFDEFSERMPSGSASIACRKNHDEIKMEVLQVCGCQKSANDSIDTMLAKCPNYVYKTLNDSDGNIIRVDGCEIIPKDYDGSFTSAEISLSGKTVPHRFYSKTSGEAIDKVRDQKNHQVEGQKFEYMDDIQKLAPYKGSDNLYNKFSMNSITGQFTSLLTSAKPATMIQLENDEVYVITVKSGYYTPCDECDTDSWFESFFAHPSTQNGVGLESIGYSTSRKSFKNNIKLGNYEDTIFGRACWLPPTMIPFSHAAKSSTVEQRRNRLKTQAALFINGYQRDWFGFNKGAIIGSFDGIKWFSIGKSRRVRARSNKLFIAINGAFGDLASSSMTTVAVHVDEGVGGVSEHDYDPTRSLVDPAQNAGATCQYYHNCNTDSDCITKLGWEYMCSDVSSYKTLWPNVDGEANEKSNAHISLYFSSLLQSGMPSGASNKRCVYRGAGSICQRDYAASNLNDNNRKLFTCAPNFHCESIQGDQFNSEIVREPKKSNSILYGQDADVLGRPMHYFKGQDSLPSEVKENLIANAQNFGLKVEQLGICRPGKKITSSSTDYNTVTQHANRDQYGRTDYISQISSCDSNAIGIHRVKSCPVIGEDGNYVYTKLSGINMPITSSINYRLEAGNQNFCGKMSQSSNGYSAFSEIEKGVLHIENDLSSEAFAVDACFRKAGAVCHTNLDCSPNELHAGLAESKGVEYFGGTMAEKSYFQENLVCSQATRPPPLPHSLTNDLQNDRYFKFDMGKNRCCRETGNDITMYTARDPMAKEETYSLNPFNYNTWNPKLAGRYSRYSSVKDLRVSGVAKANIPFAPQMPTTKGVIPEPNQWMAINEAGNETCCGSWIRKFEDGGEGHHDWTRYKGLEINKESFKCLNYRNVASMPKVDVYGDGITNDLRGGFDQQCIDPMLGGCPQQNFDIANGSDVVFPRVNNAIVVTYSTLAYRSQTDKSVYESNAGLSDYVPLVWLDHEIFKLPGNLDQSRKTIGYRRNEDNRMDGTFVAWKLPPYIHYKPNRQTNAVIYTNITQVRVIYLANGEKETVYLGNNQLRSCDANVFAASRTTNVCITEVNGQMVFIGGYDWERQVGIKNIKVQEVHFEIDFRPLNTPGYAPGKLGLGMKPGNDFYYLSKLARFELLGVPQIPLEPIFCNSDSNKLVDNLYNLDDAPNNDSSGNELTEREKFFSISYQYKKYQGTINPDTLAGIYDSSKYNRVNSAIDPTNSLGKYIFYKDDVNGEIKQRVKHEQIFSSSKFACCVPLGKTVEPGQESRCCSGYGAIDGGTGAGDGSGLLTCLLPSNTDLHVYFNKFISGEGSSKNLTEALALKDSDFNATTGEPLYNERVHAKIAALGAEFCASGKAVPGGAFGFYHGEPNNGEFRQSSNGNSSDAPTYWSIVDSDKDGDVDRQDQPRWGAYKFDKGHKWNHHLYCD